MNLALSFNKAYLDYALVMLVSFCETNREHNEIYVLHTISGLFHIINSRLVLIFSQSSGNTSGNTMHH